MNKKLDDLHIYQGFDGVSLDGFNIFLINKVASFQKGANIVKNCFQSGAYKTKLEEMNVNDVVQMGDSFLNKYFDLKPVYLASDNLDEIMKQSYCDTIDEFYWTVNNNLEYIPAVDIPIRYYPDQPRMNNTLMVFKIALNYPDHPDRKASFSHIALGGKQTLKSVPVYVHEMGHLQQSRNIGFAEDVLSEEIIPIFLEKLSALELDDKYQIFERMEKRRLLNSLKIFSCYAFQDKAEKTLMLKYIKATLLTWEMMEKYLEDSNKDKYFYDIQDVFDGKITVEEMVDRKQLSLKYFKK